MHLVSEQDRSRNQISRTRREARFLLAVSLAVGAFLRHKIFSFNLLEREARVGIEPTHTAFAEPRLTTWLPRLFDCERLSYSIARKDAKKKFRRLVRLDRACLQTANG